jgi:hypothetical protein
MASQTGRRALALWPVALGILLVLLALVWAFFLPWLASHNGFALPRACGVPTHIFYSGRSYANDAPCTTGGNAARQGCHTQSDLSAEADWPLRQVGSVPTFLGAAHPILLPPDEASAEQNGLTPTVVFVEDNPSCYLAYALEGGP